MPRINTKVVLPLIAAITVSAAARRLRALSPGGAVAAAAVGAVVVASAGCRGGAVLITFFGSSTLLGRLPGSMGPRQRRGNERDAVQVLANGGVATVLAAASALGPVSARGVLFAGFGGALATAAADTWATEIGSRSSQRPRSIATARPVPRGASGGVTWAGLVASAAGAAAIAAVMTAGTSRHPKHAHADMAAISLAGICGALADSILGATAQEVRFCDGCRLETEQRRHECGMLTRPIRGVAWCDNDVVNALATAAGAATGIMVAACSRSIGRPNLRHDV